MKEIKLNSKFSVKTFETISTWILGLSFITGTLLLLRVLSLFNKLKTSINVRYNVVDLILSLVQKNEDLKHIYTLAQIYRLFVLISIVILCIFIVFRISRMEYEKLIKSNLILYLSSIIFSFYFVFNTKDIFYALKSINNRLYSTDFSKAIYLMQKLQKIKDIRYILLVIFIMTLVLTLLAISFNIYEAVIIKDEVVYKKINIGFLTLIMSVFIILSYMQYNIRLNANIINPKDYFILAYDFDEKNNIVPVPYVNHKKAKSKYIDPYLRNFFVKGLTFDIEEKDKTLEVNKNMKIKTSYDLKSAVELELKIKDKDFYVKNDGKISALNDINLFDKKEMLKFMKKYDSKFIEKTYTKEDENTGFYYQIDKRNNIEIVYIQKIKSALLSIEDLKVKTDKDEVYQIIYIGNVFINDKNDVISYIGMASRVNRILESREEVDNFINISILKKCD